MLTETKKVSEGYKITEIGEIPVDWELKTLGQSCQIVMGQSPKGDSYNTEGSGVALLNGPTEFGEKSPKVIQWTTSPTKFCEDKDILFCVRGSSIGRMNIANQRYCIGRGLAAIRQSEETVTEYVGYILEHKMEQVLKNTSGSTFPNITKDELNRVCLPIPPLEEQRKIADILSSVDEQIDNIGQQINKIKELKKGLMQQLLTRGIGHMEFKQTEIGEIPVDWEVQVIGELFDIIGGMPIPRSKTGEGNALYLHYGDIHKSNKSLFDTVLDYDWLPNIDTNSFKIKEGTCLKNGDVVFADASEDYIDIGKNVVVRINNDDIFISGLHTIIAREKNDVLKLGYKQYCFKTENVRKQLAILATGSTVLGISKMNLAKIKFAVPPSREQEKIGEILSSVDDQIEGYEQEKEKYIELKKGLMQQLLTGKLRVTV